jgi:hypothetical protein
MVHDRVLGCCLALLSGLPVIQSPWAVFFSFLGLPIKRFFANRISLSTMLARKIFI